MKSSSKSVFKRHPLAVSISLEAFALSGVLASQLFLAPVVNAAPAGGDVVGGEGTISRSRGTTTINQASQRLAINWDSFNVAAHEKVKFEQPNASALVLNRILDQNPSKIRGSIDANGNVLLVNPRGIMFTESATVNVGGLIASGLDVSVDDFMNGNLLFKGIEGKGGAVINKGVINASSAALIGKTVHNAPTAVISAQVVSLAVGDEALLTFDADGYMGVRVTKEVLENDLGLESALLNEGSIDGGKVLLEASVSRDLFSQAVNNQGLVTATGIEVADGSIRLLASGGQMTNAGELKTQGQLFVEAEKVVNTGVMEAVGRLGDSNSVQIDARELRNTGTIDAGLGGLSIELGRDGHDNDHVLGRLTAAEAINVNARGGATGTDSFSFTSGGHYLLGEGGVVLTQGVTITGADVIDAGGAGVLQGRDGVAETFAITGSKSVQVNEMTFIDITAVDGGAGAVTDSVSGAEDWALNGVNSVRAQDITFTAVEHVRSTGAGRLTGQADVAESFVITGNQSLQTEGIAFDHIAVVNAGGGSAADRVTGADHWELAGHKRVNAGGIAFAEVEEAGSETLESWVIGRDHEAEFFRITGNKALSVDGIAFANVAAVDAGGGAVADRVSGAEQWMLNGAKSVVAKGITFTGMEQVQGIDTGSAVTARDDVAESFVITGSNVLRVDDMAFSNIATVNAGTGAAEDSVTGAANWELQGTRRVRAQGILFTEVERVEGTGSDISITGRDHVAESFVVTESKKLTVDDIMFSGVGRVSAGAGSVADRVSGAVYWNLNGDKSVTAGGITFSDVEQVSGSGASSTLTGRNDVAETFAITGNKALIANGMLFDNIAVVNGGNGAAADQVTGSAQWLLNGNQSVKAQDMTFHGMKTVGAMGDDSQLTGSANSIETFTLTGNNRVTVAGMEFAGVGSVLGQSTDRVQDGGDLHYELHSQTEARVANLRLQGLTLANIQWDAGDSIAVATGHTLSGRTIDSNGAQIVGSQAADAFTITGTHTVDYSEVTFTNVNRVDALGGQDTVVGATEWALQGDKTVHAQGITFSNIEQAGSADKTSRVTGRNHTDESFVIIGNHHLSVAGIAFDNVHQVDAGGVTQADRVTGASEWQLQGQQRVNAAGIAFTGVEQAHSAGHAATLIGRDELADAFAITGNKALAVAGIAFTNLTNVEAGTGNATDSVSGADHWQLMGHQSVNAAGMTFRGVKRAAGVESGSRITGLDDVAESFAISGHQALSTAGIAFSNVNAVAAGGGTAADHVSGAAEWQLNGHRSLIAEGITFNDIEQTDNGGLASSIRGRDGVAESFVITGRQALTVNDIAFSDITAVDAGSGTATDRVSGAEDWALQGHQSVRAGDMVFSGIEQAVSAGSAGRVIGQDNVAEAFAIAGNQAVTVDGIAFENIAVVSAGSGTAADRVTGAAEWQLNGSHSVKARNITFNGIEQAGSADQSSRITGQDGVAEAFLITGSKTVTVDAVRFENIIAVDAGAGGDDRVEVTAAGEWQMTGGQHAFTAQEIAFSGIGSAQHSSGVGGYSRVSGSDQADSFIVAGTREIIANGVRIKGVDTVDGRGNTGGNDVLVSNKVEVWQLSTDAAVQVEHSGIQFAGLEEVQGAMGSSLKGTSGNDNFVVGAEANQVSRDNLTYSNITRIDGGTGEDTLNADQGHTWQLTDVAQQLVVNGITYSNINIANATDAVVKGRDGVADTFDIGATHQQLTTHGMVFNRVTRVDGGAGAGDRVVAHTTGEWLLTPEPNSVQAAGITFAGVEVADVSAAVTTLGTLAGSGANETFDISGSQPNAVSVNGIAFTHIGSVQAGAGENRVVSADAERWSLTGVNGQVSSDDIQFTGVSAAGATAGSTSLSTLRGSGSDETYVIDAAHNALEVSGIRFDHLGAVDAGGGRDTVRNSRETHWRAAERDGRWGERSAETEINSIWVLFENIEQVMNTGRFSGPSVGVDYTLTDTHAVQVGGIHFGGVSAIHGGVGVDTLHGLDLDTNWTLNGRSGSTQHLSFTGIDTIRAGAARDVFTFNSGVSGNVYTGAGDDAVYLSGGSVTGLYLQGGADQVVVNHAGSSAMLLDGGAGDDSLTSNLTDLTWKITGNVNQLNYLGDYAFTGFETLRNNSPLLRVNSSLAAAFAIDHVVFDKAGISLGYQPNGDIQWTSHYRGANALSGSISGVALDIRTAGDVDLRTQVERLNILNLDNHSLRINVREADSLVVGQIHAGAGGTISLTSMGLGALTAEARGVTHLTADTVNLGSEWQRWSAIGEQLIPLRMEVGRAVNIVALSYVEPEFVNGIPALTATGNRLQSVTGAVASQGMKSAVQVNVDQFTQVDPAIFTSISPYRVDADPLNAPEYALVAGELTPAGGVAQSSGEADVERTTLKQQDE